MSQNIYTDHTCPLILFFLIQVEWLHWSEVAADKEDGISFCFPQFVHQLPDRLPFIEMSRAWSTL